MSAADTLIGTFAVIFCATVLGFFIYLIMKYTQKSGENEINKVTVKDLEIEKNVNAMDLSALVSRNNSTNGSKPNKP